VSAVEKAAAVLAEHLFTVPHMGVNVGCVCGWETPWDKPLHDTYKDHASHVAAALADAGLLAAEDAALRARIEALCRRPDGQREWHNQGRSGWCDVVDVHRLRAALSSHPDPTNQPAEGEA
jgi:hypothetical protein